MNSFESLSKEFNEQGLKVKILNEDDRVTIIVHHDDEIDFKYQIRIREFDPPSFTLSDQPDDRYPLSFHRHPWSLHLRDCIAC